MGPEIDEGGELGPLLTTGKPQTALDIFERLAKIFAIVAIPVVIPIALAIYSARVQSAAQTETINRDYVQLAVSLLKEKSTVDQGLRDWAVDLLAAHSPTEFKPEVIASLKSGQVTLPGANPLLVQAYSYDGELVALADSVEVQLIERTHGSKIRFRLPMHSLVTSLDFTRKGDLLAVGFDDGSLSIYMTDTGKKSVEMRVPEPIVWAAFITDEKLRITTKNTSAYYDPKTGERLPEIPR